MEQKSGAWLLCCCVCVCVSLWAKSNETKIPDQNGKNQPRKVCCVPNVWECVCVFKCVCVCVSARKREGDNGRKWWRKRVLGGKQAFARCSDPEFNSWQNAESGFGLSSHKWTSGCHLVFPFSNAEMCGERRHWRAGFEKTEREQRWHRMNQLSQQETSPRQ